MARCTNLTIGSEETRSYQSRVSEFARQQSENTCLTRAIQNVLGDLARRHEVPELTLDHETVKEICDHRPGIGAVAEPLPEALDTEIEAYGYRGRVETEIGESKLESIIEAEDCSLPIAELSASYLHHVEEYDVQAGMYGEAIPHTVVVFTVNHDEVQFFDPYEDFYTTPENGGAPPSRLQKSQFFQWWTEAEPQWTMWIQREPQRTLDQAAESEEERR